MLLQDYKVQFVEFTGHISKLRSKDERHKPVLDRLKVNVIRFAVLCLVRIIATKSSRQNVDELRQNGEEHQ